MAERGIIFKDDFVSQPNKSWFDMSYDFLFSMNIGDLVPSTCVECMPEDIIHAKSDSFVRLAPLVAPTFGKVNMFSYHFYVRNKDIWTSWRDFITNSDQRLSWQQSIGSQFTPPEMPYIDIFQLIGCVACDKFWRVDAPEANSIKPWVMPEYLNVAYQVGEGAKALEFEFDSIASEYVKYLVVFYDGTNWNGMITPTPWSPNEDYPTYIVPFLQNKNESYVDGEKHVYNPFSNGTLFDYLGVDLQGYYEKQTAYFKEANADLRSIIDGTSLSDFTENPHDIAPFDHWEDSDAYVFGQDGTFVGFDGDFFEFFRHHICFSITYSHNNQWSSVTSLGYGVAYDSDDAHAAEVNALQYTPLIGDYTQDKVEAQCISTLPIRAYNFIYNDYFRDENYISANSNIDFTRSGCDIDFANVDLNANDVFRYFTLEVKAYEHDPYTTALPSAQRGQPVRFLTDAHLKLSDYTISGTSKTTAATAADVDGERFSYVGTGADYNYSGRKEVLVDLSAATIENFRFANACQRYLEKSARAGSRYYEYMKAIFGSDIPSEKLDRPIYLGGDKSPIQVSEVLQTSATEITSEQPLGQMAGRAVSVGNDNYLEYVAPDHGFFIEINVVVPRTNYQTGINPMFTRQTYLDYPIPEFAQLGEEPVLQRELWFSADDSDQIPFGYQSRYYQHKYNRDRTSGSFKDDLDFWTWTRKFDNAPIMGREFIEVRPDYRQFAVIDPSQEHIYVHMFHDLQINRCLPVFGMPSL